MTSLVWRSVALRVRQAGHALTARWERGDEALLSVLLPAERALFDRLPPADRAHALRVTARLHEAGQTEPRLLRAALLHDIGKAGQGVHLPHRVARVLLQAVAPATWARLADTAVGWQRPFYALAHHAETGAALVAAAGDEPVTVALVRFHDAPSIPPALANYADWLRALQAADDEG